MSAPDAAPRHGVVLLAAGSSSRLGRPKQLVMLEGESLVRRAARLALATEPADAVVVLGAAEPETRAAIAGLPLRTVVCAEWAEGMGRSLRAGLGPLAAECAGALVLLCDQPALTGEHLGRLVAAWREAPEKAAASGYAGVTGVPALLPRSWWSALEGAGDRGARDLLRVRAGDVRVVACEALVKDVDLPRDAG